MAGRRYAQYAPTPNKDESKQKDDFDKTVTDDAFQRAVAEKTNLYLLGKQDAEIEVYLDLVIDREGDKDKALMYIIENLHNEERVQVLLSCLLMSRGADPSVKSSSQQQTPLHVAVRRKFKGICKKLLEKGAWPNAKDRQGLLPFSIAQGNEDDDIASMLILYMKNHEVRQLFSSSGKKPAEFSIHDLLRSKKMEKTVMAVLDCMIDLEGTDGKATAYFHILESDKKGRSPETMYFNKNDRSPFQIIAKTGNKTIINHDIVRLLIRRKWKHYARKRFLLDAILFLANLLCLAYAAITAVMAEDPLVYKNPRDVIRAICEVICVIAAIVTICMETRHITRQKLEYFKEKFNYLELSSCLFLLVLIPLRFTNHDNQWQIYSVVFLLWTVRIFKYAAVFRQTGAYAQILVRVIAKDFVQFMLVFTVFLLVFSGTLLLALRGEIQTAGISDTSETLLQGLRAENQTAVVIDTSSFWTVLFLGLRILIESEKVIEYTDMDPWSIFIMVLFLFSCIVLLLNLLIAQLSDTYHKIQQDAQRGLEVNRAWIVGRMELRTTLIQKGARFKHYLERKEIMDMSKVLGKWESPPLQEINKNIQTIGESVETQKHNLQSVTTRLARQERTLIRIQETLDFLARRTIRDLMINTPDDKT